MGNVCSHDTKKVKFSGKVTKIDYELSEEERKDKTEAYRYNLNYAKKYRNQFEDDSHSFAEKEQERLNNRDDCNLGCNIL